MQNVYSNQELINTLQGGGVVVMPTDTIYGILCSAMNETVVEKLYKIRERNEKKPCIILVSDLEEVSKFGVVLGEVERKILKEFFALPKPTSFILDCLEDKFKYLHRGTQSLSFRIPKNQDLINLLKITGPLIAPSANLEGKNPAKNITEAQNYFGDKVDLYIEGGEIKGEASRIIKLDSEGGFIILRH